MEYAIIHATFHYSMLRPLYHFSVHIFGGEKTNGERVGGEGGEKQREQTTGALIQSTISVNCVPFVIDSGIVLLQQIPNSSTYIFRAMCSH